MGKRIAVLVNYLTESLHAVICARRSVADDPHTAVVNIERVALSRFSVGNAHARAAFARSFGGAGTQLHRSGAKLLDLTLQCNGDLGYSAVASVFNGNSGDFPEIDRSARQLRFVRCGDYFHDNTVLFQT